MAMDLARLQIPIDVDCPEHGLKLWVLVIVSDDGRVVVWKGCPSCPGSDCLTLSV